MFEPTNQHDWVIAVQRLMSHFGAYRGKYIRWDDNVHSVLGWHLLDCYSATSLKQLSTGRHVASHPESVTSGICSYLFLNVVCWRRNNKFINITVLIWRNRDTNPWSIALGCDHSNASTMRFKPIWSHNSYRCDIVRWKIHAAKGPMTLIYLRSNMFSCF